MSNPNSSMSFCIGLVPETFKCYICGKDLGAGHNHRTNTPAVCCNHVDESHEFEDNYCIVCGEYQEYEPYDDY